ncbi:MAG: DNA topoisomerase, partial [Firmicutes bacterium]|nr:DNA topoisomerase [Bacillota bacterium]
AKEDYLMGINFSRLLTLCYGGVISRKLGKKYVVIAVGRVMTCVLGMIVQREREIRDFIKTPYYKINGTFQLAETLDYDGEWKAIEGSDYYMSELLFKDIGFIDKDVAEKFVLDLHTGNEQLVATIEEAKRKKETKNPPLLYNLAELQNELSKKLKINPDETLKIVQNLYEKKMVTYPRTDARVLSTAVAKEIGENLQGLLRIKDICRLDQGNIDVGEYVAEVYQKGLYKGLEKTKYVNDKGITDHYAIIPTGQGLESFNTLNSRQKKTYIYIVRRFLAIFYPPAIFSRLTIITKIKRESFFTTSKICLQEGYLTVLGEGKKDDATKTDKEDIVKNLKKGHNVKVADLTIKESETTPPKRYTSGSMILAMENAGKLIEDEELRAQIKGSGIGTSATRAAILNKLQKIDYIDLNNKSQILSPTTLGEMIFDVVNQSIPTLLKPELTASWEKGLNLIANGEIKSDEYMIKLESYITKNTKKVLASGNEQGGRRRATSTVTRASSGTVSKTGARVALGKCIACSDGEVFENTKAFYCSNWRNNCKFTTWKNSLAAYEQEVTTELLKDLLHKGKVESLKITLPQAKEKSTATVRFTDDKSGRLELVDIHKS